jgi:hypothetical protein
MKNDWKRFSLLAISYNDFEVRRAAFFAEIKDAFEKLGNGGD